MKLTVPTHIIATIISQADLADIDRIALGISTDEPTAQDTTLGNQVADFPATATLNAGTLTIHTAIEYGIQLGVNEIGLYAGDKLVATINAQINRINNHALIFMQEERVYLVNIEIDTNAIVDNTTPATLQVDEREDITFAMASALQQVKGSGTNSLVAPTRIGQVLTSQVVNGKLIAVWDNLANVPQNSSEFVPSSPVTNAPSNYRIEGDEIIVPMNGWLDMDISLYDELYPQAKPLTLLMRATTAIEQVQKRLTTAFNTAEYGGWEMVDDNTNRRYNLMFFNTNEDHFQAPAVLRSYLRFNDETEPTAFRIAPITQANVGKLYDGFEPEKLVSEDTANNPMFIPKASKLSIIDYVDIQQDDWSVVTWLKKICHLPDNIKTISFESDICVNPNFVDD